MSTFFFKLNIEPESNFSLIFENSESITLKSRLNLIGIFRSAIFHNFFCILNFLFQLKFHVFIIDCTLGNAFNIYIYSNRFTRKVTEYKKKLYYMSIVMFHKRVFNLN